jgi:phosphoribosylformylglycinamidine cyclo-ligase
MCVNDIICMGAKPLFFLDYIGIGKLDPDVAADLVFGVSEGCVQAGCALIGGETAELSGIYGEGEYDLAGFAVGVVEKSKLITGEKIRPGDAIIGVASSGLHSNGFTLVRKLAFEKAGYNPDDFIPELNTTLADELLKPTKIYAKLMAELTSKHDIKGAANITGGGWVENIPRIAGGAEDVKLVLNAGAAPVPVIFSLLKQWGGVSDMNMYNTFNMGIGFTAAVGPSEAEAAVETINASGERAYIIGRVESREPGEGPITINGFQNP